MAGKNVTVSLSLKTGGTAALKSALVELTKQLQSQEQALVKVRAALDPSLIKERVRLENELTKGQLEYNAALEKERNLQGSVADKAKVAHQLQMEQLKKQRSFAEHKERAKQLGPMGAVADFFGLGGGGRVGEMMNRAGGTLSGVGESMGGKIGGHLSKLGNFLGGASKTPSAAVPEVLPAGASKTPSAAVPEVLPAGASKTPSAAVPEVLPAGASKTPSAAVPEVLPAGASKTPSAAVPEVLPAGASKTPSAAVPEVLPAGGAKATAAAAGGAEAAGAAGAGATGMAAAAGPIGMAVAAAAMLAPVVKGLAAAPFKTVASGMAGVNNALQGLNGKLGVIGSALGGASGALDGFSSAMKYINPVAAGVAAGLSEVAKQFQAFLGIAVDLAQKAQPGSVKRFTLAMDDAAAVVGQRMVPVVDLMTTVGRGLGDMLQTVLPSMDEVRDALAPLGEAWDTVKEALTPVIFYIKGALGMGLKILGAAFKQAGMALKILLGPLGSLAKLAGMKLDSSVGAAARSIHFGDVAGAAKQSWASGYTNSDTSPQKQTATAASKMVELLQKIVDWLPGANKGGGDKGLDGGDKAADKAVAGWNYLFGG